MWARVLDVCQVGGRAGGEGRDGCSAHAADALPTSGAPVTLAAAPPSRTSHAQELKGLSVVLDATPAPFCLELAALAARREYLNLERWLPDQFTAKGSAFMQAAVSFLDSRLRSDGPALQAAATATQPLGGGAAAPGGGRIALSEGTLEVFPARAGRQCGPAAQRHAAAVQAGAGGGSGAASRTGRVVVGEAGVARGVCPLTLVRRRGWKWGRGRERAQRRGQPGAPTARPTVFPTGPLTHPRVPCPPLQRRRPMPTSSVCTPARSLWMGWWRCGGGGQARGVRTKEQAPLGAATCRAAPCACIEPVPLAPPRPAPPHGPPQVLRGFKNSTLGREQEVFACMVHNLFDEYRFFPKYPTGSCTPRVRAVVGWLQPSGCSHGGCLPAARCGAAAAPPHARPPSPAPPAALLFGQLIHHSLVSSVSLGIALRYMLEALRSGPGSKMFRFGVTRAAPVCGRPGAVAPVLRAPAAGCRGCARRSRSWPPPSTRRWPP